MNLATKLFTILAPSGAAAPFTPISRANLSRWYERGRSAVFQASDGTGVVADGDPVGYWQDLSANAENALQTVAGDKPLYRSNNTPLGGGAIDFVSSDLLKWTTPLTLGDYDAWFVVAMDAVTGTRVFLGSSASDNNFICTTSATQTLVNYNTANAFTTISALSATTKYVLNFTRTGAITTCYINNVSQGTVSQAGSLAAIDQLASRGNKTSVLDGQMSAMLLYTAAPTSQERTDTYTYLNSL